MTFVRAVLLAAATAATCGVGVAAASPTLTVDATHGRHAISPDIYGLNGADATLAADLDLPVDRWGFGNPGDTYNYQANASGAGLDYYFEDFGGCQGSCVPDWQTWINHDRAIQPRPRTLLPLPLAGYVARGGAASQLAACGYPRQLYPNQNSSPASYPSQDPFDPYASCGNGRNQGTTLAQSWNGTAWSLSSPVDSPGAATSYLASDSCPANGTCVAVGASAVEPGPVCCSAVGQGSYTALAEGLSGATWTLQTVPTPTGATQSWLAAVSCGSAMSCLAVGDYRDAGGSWHGLAEHWNGTAWSLLTPASPSGAVNTFLTGVSCPAAGACVLLGERQGSDANWTAFVDHWDGTSFTIQQVTAPTGTTESFLTSVSCTSSTACTAVGSYGGSNGSGMPFVERLSGTAWSNQTAPDPGSVLTSVTCAPDGSCTAVGYDGSGSSPQGSLAAVIDQWDGATWTQQTVPAIANSQYVTLRSVACRSATACKAVGSYQSPQDQSWSMLALSLSGTTWTTQTPAAVAGATQVLPAAVSCATATSCTVVGNRAVGGSDPVVRIPAIPLNSGVPAGTSFDSAYVHKVTSVYGPASSGGVAIYELGNEPELWGDTHSDIHPGPETANEIVSKSIATADAVKSIDPSAAVLGFSVSGWGGYFCSGADTTGAGCNDPADGGCTTSPDCANHGNIPMTEWFLQQFHNHDLQTGSRHLDYLDVHYYASGGSTPDVTRSLWDPTYTDPSWINNQIDLLPRLRNWIGGNSDCGSHGCYPGTKIALTEYNLSVSPDPKVDGIIQADVLGIFAREGVSLATRFALSADPSCPVANGCTIADAFRLYRNYDGHHSQFGDTWISSSSTDQSQLAVYSAQRSSDGAYTIAVLNKSGGALTSRLNLVGITAAQPTAETWRWTGTGITSAAPVPIAAGTITTNYPADSMTLYVIKPPATSTTTTTTTTTTSQTTSTQTSTSTTQTSSSTGTTQPSSSTVTSQDHVSGPANTAAPAARGVGTVGQKVSTTNGSWSGTQPFSFGYQWQRCAPTCADISGATAPSYTLTSADLGASIRAVVAAVNSAGAAFAATNRLGPVQPSAIQIATALQTLGVPKARLGAILRAGGYTFSWSAPGPGRATEIWWRGHTKVGTGTGTTSSRWNVRLKLRLTKAGRRILRKAGRTLKLTSSASFAPAGGHNTTNTSAFKIRR